MSDWRNVLLYEIHEAETRIRALEALATPPTAERVGPKALDDAAVFAATAASLRLERFDMLGPSDQLVRLTDGEGPTDGR